MTSMTSLTSILLEYFVSNIAVTVLLNGNRQTEIAHVDSRTTRLGCETFHIGHSTIAHALTNHHLSQFFHCYQEQADKENNLYTNCISQRAGVKNTNCLLIPHLTQEPSTSHCANPISTW